MTGGRRSPVPRLHVVTDDAVLAHPRFVEEARRILAAGSVALHLRGPGTSGRRLLALGRELLDAAGPPPHPEALLVVNDRVDVALALVAHPGTHAGTDAETDVWTDAAPRVALHLPRRGLPLAVVRDRLPGARALPAGVSAEIAPASRPDAGAGGASPTEPTPGPAPAAPAESRGDPDWILVGTLFPSRSHPGRPGAGLKALAARRGAAPLVAIGGITLKTAASVMETGVHGVAVRSAAWGTPAAPEPDPAGAVGRLLETLSSSALQASP
jgi:thiamine monophosphate synthase